MSPGTSPWTVQQRRWLQALGHAVLRVGDDEPLPVSAADPAPEAGRLAREATPRVAAPDRAGPVAVPQLDRPARRAPAAPAGPAADSANAPVPAAPGSMRRPSRLPDRLQLAMLRASGLDPADPAAQEAMARWPVDRLRGDGAAKRAFWPELRALRRRP